MSRSRGRDALDTIFRAVYAGETEVRHARHRPMTPVSALEVAMKSTLRRAQPAPLPACRALRRR